MFCKLTGEEDIRATDNCKSCKAVALIFPSTVSLQNIISYDNR